jgi:hypothetical protein
MIDNISYALEDSRITGITIGAFTGSMIGYLGYTYVHTREPELKGYKLGLLIDHAMHLYDLGMPAHLIKNLLQMSMISTTISDKHT